MCKLIRCKNCEDIVRLVHTKWRKCECGQSGGQYNDDLLSATVGGNCEVIGIRNDFFQSKPFSKKRDEDGKNGIIQGEYEGDTQIHRIKSADGPKLKTEIKEIDDETNEITFIDRRKYTINLKGNKSPKTIKLPINKNGPSFKKDELKETIKNSIRKIINEELSIKKGDKLMATKTIPGSRTAGKIYTVLGTHNTPYNREE